MIGTTGIALAILGAALAVALCGIGSSIGVGLTGQVSSGVMSEDPKAFGRLLLLNVLPATQGVYGAIVAFLVMLQIGFLGGKPLVLTWIQGLQIFLACLPIAFAGLFSAIHQGKVCAAGVRMVSKQPQEVGKALVIGVLVEFYAILGLLVSILFLFNMQL